MELSKEDLEEFGGWLFMEGFYAARNTYDHRRTNKQDFCEDPYGPDGEIKDPYGTLRRDKAVAKILKKLQVQLQQRTVHVERSKVNV